MNQAPACRVCSGPLVRTLNFGNQPLTNQFLKQPSEGAYAFELGQAVCGTCGVVQLTQAPSVDEVRPRFDWITYNEPEGHLDELVKKLCELPGIKKTSSIGAVTFKDDSTLLRFSKLGYKNTYRLDPKKDLGIDHPLAGIETIQQKIDEKSAAAVLKKRAPFDLLIVRHVFEHAHDLKRFVDGLRALTADGGYIVLELPDSVKLLETAEHSAVWEEHIFYFTKETLLNTLAFFGFDVALFTSYPYALEDSLVAVLKNKRGKAKAVKPGNVDEEVRRFEKYAAAFPERRSMIQSALMERKNRGEKIAFLGAGHHTCQFINLYGLSGWAEFVADDFPQKQGLLMPGSRLPIVGSRFLLDNDIGVCLLGLSPESEARVVAKNKAFTDKGGVFMNFYAFKTN